MPPIRVFTAHDTGAKTMAWSAAQDRRGVMYFGCDALVAFDGDRWRPQDVGASYLIRGLDIGPNGRIWVGGVNEIGWFEPDGINSLVYHSLVGSLPASDAALGDVWAVYADGNESAVFIAGNRILRWDGRRFHSWRYPGTDVLWSARTQKGIYFHSPGDGLMKVGELGPVVAAGVEAVGLSPIRWLDDSGSDWLLLNADGFHVLRGGKSEPLESEASAFVRSNTPTSAVSLDRELLAIGTIKGGIAIVDHRGRLRRVFDHKSGLPSDQVYSLFVDREGALWSMGPTSISRLAIRSEVSVFGPRYGYPENGCASLAESSGEMYAVSHNEILHLVPDSEPGRAGHFAPLGVTSDRFYGLSPVPNGLVVGHIHGLGLLRADGMHALGGSKEIVLRLGPSLSHPGLVLVSHQDSVDLVDSVSGRTTPVAESLPDYGDTFAEDSKGRLWIGTESKGLFVVSRGSTQAAPAASRFGRLPSAGPALVGNAGTSIVVLTREGAQFLDPGEQTFRAVSGSPEGTPSAISNSDGRSSVWASFEPEASGRSTRLGRITVTATGATWSPLSVEGLQGVGSTLALNVIHGDEGDTLWIAGTEALLRVGPEALSRSAQPHRPSVHAWVISADGKPAAPVEGALPYASERIHAEFTSLEFGMKEAERYQTMLLGAESGWSTPADSPERDLSGLRDGTYDLLVRLKDDSGRVGPPAVFHFEIASPWWRTPLAYCSFIFSAVALITASTWVRQRTLRRRARMLEETVRQRTEELEKANAAKSKFVASISHEIRNPMGGILGSSLALSQTQLNARQRELVSTLRSCASFLTSLVDDILDLAAIEAGVLKIVPAPMDPRTTLDSVVAMLKSRAGESHLEVAVGAGMPEAVVCDAARVQQVIVNFAVNSLKFGGRSIRLSAEIREGCIVFSVTDDGSGIPNDEQKNLFLPFSRLESARNSAIPGSGLGLAVSRMLAEQMGGSVGVESEVGRGSTFFLSLPFVAALPSETRTRHLFVRGARALVVEDIEYNAGAMGWMLEGLGFKVDFAADGEIALGELACRNYDVVFLDCDIPKIDGFEVTRRFRASETEGRRTLVIATTALSTASDHEACRRSGMDAFLAKPVTPEKLSAILLSAKGTRFSEETADLSSPTPSWDREPDLELIRRLTDGSSGGLARELGRYLASLDEAMAGLAAARGTRAPQALASAAHRILSLARIVGAGSLSAAAADLQEFAAVYNPQEIDEQVVLVRREVDALHVNLERHLNRAPSPA
ncbi:MAG TPA: ATP-binding protein [Opitutaceae bacterium]|jgi:signal transduction histidine kinase/CheY-like chemotaxis protein